MIDLERGTQSRLTFDDNMYSGATWFTDGKNLIAAGGPQSSPNLFELIKISVEGTTPPLIIKKKGLFPELTPDQSTLLYAHFTESGDLDIGATDLTEVDASRVGETVETQTIVRDPQWQYAPQVSPDGRLLAYVSRETGRDEIYLRRYPEGDKKRQISADGGGWPMWSASGDMLYYMSDLDLVEVDVVREPALRVSAPRVLFTRPRGEDQFGVGWPLYFQVEGDGEHFFMLHEMGQAQGNRPLLFVQNWVQEFEQE